MIKMQLIRLHLFLSVPNAYITVNNLRDFIRVWLKTGHFSILHIIYNAIRVVAKFIKTMF